MKKRISVLLAFFLFVSLFSWIQPVRALDPADVTPVPHTGGKPAQYTITFDLGTGAAYAIPATGYFKITFPTDTKLPTSIAKADVTVNGTSPTADPTISGQTVRILTPSAYADGTTMTIVFMLTANIKNPLTTTGMLRLKVETGYLVGSTETKIEGPVDSNKYFIGFPATVTPSPNTDTPSVGTEYVEYKIAWKTGNEGALSKNTDTITIVFDAAYTLATWPGLGYIPGNYFTVNGTKVTSNAVCSGTPLTITLKTPVDIANSTAVTIIMTTQIGITNPVAGDYDLSVSSSKETTATDSLEYTIVNAISFTDQNILTAGVQGVIVTPPSVSSEAEYKVGLEIDIPLTATLGTISIAFPNGTTLPSTINMTDIIFAVNGTPTPLALAPTKSSNVIVITVPVDIVAGDDVVITFLANMKIKNPSTAGNYSIQALTSAQPFYRVSPPYAIGTAVSALKVTPSPNAKDAINVRYDVEFKLGSNGALTGNSDTIVLFLKVAAPAAPASLSTSSVLVGADYTTFQTDVATPLPTDGVPAGYTKFTITPPKNIAASQTVKIAFLSTAGITNPVTGNYTAFAKTSKEPILVESAYYSITDTVDIPTAPVVEPPAAGVEAKYTFDVVIGQALAINEGTISVAFPTGTTVPTTITPGNITINGTPLTFPVTVSGGIVTMTVPQTYAAGTTLTIEFTAACKIKNPTKVGVYSLQVKTSTQPNYRVSPVYAIGTSVTGVKVTPIPDTKTSTNVQYLIEFKLGANGALTANTDTIDIFLNLTAPLAPSTIQAASVTVNGNYCISNVPVATPLAGEPVGTVKLTVTVPKDIAASQTVKVVFLSSAGLQNPVEGNYKGYVRTSKEPILMESTLYLITNAVDITSVVVTPPSTSVEAKYEISMNIGQALTKDIDEITVTFPSGTTVPTNITPGSITINGIPLTFAPKVTGTSVTMKVPASLTVSPPPVQIVFLLSAKIKNPTTAGIYSLQIKTSTQPYYRVSPSYAIGTAVSTVKVTPVPNTKFSTNVQYLVEFKLGANGALAANTDKITIIMKVTHVPVPPTSLPASSVLVGSDYTLVATTVEEIAPLDPTDPDLVGYYRFTVTPPKAIASSATVKITFLSSAGLINPDAGNYKAYVRTNQEPIRVDSEYYLIADALDIMSVTVNPPSTGTVAEYKIVFQVGTALIQDLGTITVAFPTGTTIPTLIPVTAVTVDATGTPVILKVNPKVTGTKVEITTPIDIPIATPITLIFKIAAGIKNPTTPNMYKLQMMTSAQPYFRESLPYPIGSSVTNVKIIPMPNNIGAENVEYKITFKIGPTKLTRNTDKIYVYLPGIATALGTISAASIMINDVFTELTATSTYPAVNPPDTDFIYRLFEITTPVDIAANSEVSVILLSSCGIQNPTAEGIVWGYAATSQENIPMKSELYNIMDTLAFPGINPPTDFRSVVVKPNAINLQAQYLIHFRTSATKPALQANVGTITFAFPQGTKVPGSISSGSIYIYTAPPSAPITAPDAVICPPGAGWTVLNQPVYVTGQEVKIITPVTVGAGADAYVLFCPSANLQNPAEAGLYTLQVKTSSQPVYGVSRSYLIRSTIEKPTVIPVPAVTSQPAEYTITLKTGKQGELTANQDKIFIAFNGDVGRYLNPVGPIAASAVKINGVYMNIQATVNTGVTLPVNVDNAPSWPTFRWIEMQVPQNIPASSDVTIYFTLTAGFINPATADNYTAALWTNKEPVAIESYIYTIGDAITNVTVPPAYPNPKTSGSVAEYYVNFTTGLSPASLLSPALSSTITMIFPEGTKLPTTVNPADIKIGIGGSCPNPTTSALPPVVVDGQSIRFAVPFVINPGDTVCVKLLQGVQITNPPTPGSYRLQVMTSSQPIPAYSNYYTILSTSSIPKVTATPPAINSLNTDYLIEFTTGTNGSLWNNIGKILIFFDPSYVGVDYTLGFMPNPSPYPPLLTSVPPNSIYINDVVVNSITKVVNSGPGLTYLEIITPVDIAASSAVKVHITNLVGIQNPPLVGLYRLVVMTSSEPTPVESQNFSLFSSITAPTVVLSVSNNTRPNPNGNTPMANAQYSIQFMTGPAGNLVADYGTITIQFPEDTIIPAYISPGSVKVNGTTLKYAPQIDAANRKVTMIVPINIGILANVEVIFSELANLKNPSQPGSYTLWVSTSSEPLAIKSNPYAIEGVSGAKVTLDPCLFDSTSVKYTFSFVITKALAAGNYIYIEFPYGTKLASVISGSHVLVNGKPANTGTFPQIVVDKQQVQIRIPEAIPALSQVEVTFMPDARVTNPGIGTYVAKIRTDFDTNPADVDNDPDNRWVETLPYYICSNVAITSLEITPTAATLAKGESKSFTVVAKDENGNEINSGLTYLWSVSGSIGSVTPVNTKQVTFLAGQNPGTGTLKVEVTYGGNTITASADISVAAALASVSITPSTSTIGLNQTQVFTATALDELGNVMNLDFEWSITGAVGSITPLFGKSTTFTSTTVGSGTIKAKAVFNAITKEASASVTVSTTPPPPPPDKDDQVVTGALTPASVRANQGDVAIQVVVTALVDISTGGVVELTIPEMWPSPSTVAGAQGFVTALAKSPAVITVPPTVNGRVISVNIQKMVKGNSFTISYSKVSAPSTPGEYSFPLKAKSTSSGSFVSVTDAPKILVTSISDGSGRAAITPNEASAGAEGQKFEITYTADAVLDGGAVSITMPDGWSKPSLVATVQGFVQLKEPNGNIGAIEVFDATVTIPVMKMGVNEKVTLVYSNVRVPNVENTYTFIVKSKGLGGDLKNIALNPTVAVRTTRADTVKVEVIPNMTSVPAEYTVTFKASKTGFMAKDTGTITFIFPPETGIPTTIKSELITVNGNPLKTPPEVDSIRSTIKIVTPVDLEPAVLVQVKFASDSGITNPKTAKEDYKIRLYTSTDTLPADSATYRIIVSSLRNIKVAVSPIVPGASAQYKIQAKTGGAGALNVNQDSITVMFPADTTLPSSIAANLVTVNGTALQMRPTIDITQRKMTVLLPVKIENDSEFTLTIASEANIKNPSRDGMYKIKLFTSKEINPIESEPYQIGQSLLGDVKVNLSTSLVEATNVTYTISFRTGAYGSLVVGETISVTFDRRYVLPSIQAYQISVNGVVCTITPEVREGNTLIINTPIGISSESTATLTISGVTNPKESGEYTLSLSTKAEPNPVMSTSYRIGLVLETEIAINPTEANGLAGWYTIAPNIVLSNAIPSARIFYAWDDGPFTPYTGSSITAPEGIHTFYCYSTAEGLEDEPKKSLLTKVDTKGPVIQLTQPTEGSTFFAPDIVVEGNVDEANDFTVTVNGKPATVTNKRFTINITLNPGDNWLDIVATDAAGNRSITPRIRVNYSQPSEIKITVTSPKALTSVYPFLKATTGGASQLTAVLRVTGKIEPANATEISVYILGKMQNPVKLPVAADGSFDGDVEVPLVSGLNGITLTVKDKITGKEFQTSVAVIAKVTLRLQIGNALAFLNDKEYRLDAPPYIKNARTMVPMRFIGESLGASVSWIAATKSVIYVLDTTQIQLTIGNINAVVTQGDKKQTIKLDAAPEIVKSRTFIPLRFVSENFGATVEWDAAQKKITVTK